MNPLGFPFMSGSHYWTFGLLALWSIPWKGWALWRSARLGQKPWFIALLVLNTAGILEIIYLFVITDAKGEKPSKPVAK